MVVLFYYILIISAIVLLAGSLPFLVQSQPSVDSEKLSAYECGFEPFGDARETFDVHFYLVGIMFIAFDVEIAFLFPWALVYQAGDSSMFEVFFILCLVFIAGFIFEYRLNVLD